MIIVSDLSHKGFKSTAGAEVKPCEGKLVIFTANPTVPVTQLNCTSNGQLDFDYNNMHYTHQVLNETRVELNGEDGVNFIDS
ncbi:MAG: hypothetical protein LN568_04980 [Rickettsia endosymbiont of Pseudomimeciton antennatum]|nr:hypothetical protein [Rickettsia endosymbiont of Pseudomimeciton antennatum]